MATHKELNAWKNSVNLVVKIYNLTKNFPEYELFGIVSQMRRASVSIPSNIAEGAARNHKKEYLQFLYIALSSLAEVETLIIISLELNYISPSDFEEFDSKMKVIRTQISGLIRHHKSVK